MGLLEEIIEKLSEVQETLSEIKNKPDPVPPDSDEEKFLTTDELCDLLSVTRTTLWNWERKGIIRAVMIDNTKRFLRSEILALGDKTGLHRGT